MYHPSRGGVRGGRDQFKWDDVKVDKHRENYLGHSLKAPVGRWQKGKDLHWYTREKSSLKSDVEAARAEMKAEIQRIKEEEEQAMQEALGLAPKRSIRPQGNRLDKHELAELVKRGSTAEDLGGGHAEAARVDGLGFSRAHRSYAESSLLPSTQEIPPEGSNAAPPMSTRRSAEEGSEDESRRKRKRDERKHERREEKQEKREKRRSHDSDGKRKHKMEKHKKRNDSD